MSKKKRKIDREKALEREVALLRSTISRLTMTLFSPVNEDPTMGYNLRANSIRINRNFAQFMIPLEMINVGDAPNDNRGDPLRDGMMKVNRNFLAIEQAILRAEDEQAQTKRKG